MFFKPVAHYSVAACLMLAAAFTPETATAQAAPAPQLVADRTEMSAKTGGWQHFDLNADPQRGGQGYIILGSISGTEPGVQFQGFTIPLNYDVYTEFCLTRPNAGFIRNQLGKLDAAGYASADFWVPANLAKDLVGLEITHCAVVVKQGKITGVSNPARLVLTQ